MLQEQAAFASSPAAIRRLTGTLVAMLTKSPRRPAWPEPHLSQHKRHRVKDFQKDPYSTTVAFGSKIGTFLTPPP